VLTAFRRFPNPLAVFKASTSKGRPGKERGSRWKGERRGGAGLREELVKDFKSRVRKGASPSIDIHINT